jgi:hypothetical protein
MATQPQSSRELAALPGRCECDGESMAVTVTRLGVEGCSLVADGVWSAEDDFVHLEIAGTLSMNGRLVRIAGQRAEVRFFGQLHPAAIAKLLEAPTP